MPRRTKIIATIGPATDEPEKLKALIAAGADVVRVNFSHGTKELHHQRITQAKRCAKQLNKPLGILADLQGPKIRIARFANSTGIKLIEGTTFILDSQFSPTQGNERVVGLDYPQLPQEVYPNDELLLDDGRLVLKVKEVKDTQIISEVICGGVLTSNKGVNRKGGGLSAPSLTEKDIQDIQFLATLPIDYVAISFPKSAADIHLAKKLLAQAGSEAFLVAKIERVEAVENIDEIIEAADAVMVARGDLGVEIGYAQLPAVQKRIIHRARSLDKVVITATQMMESMISNPIPTRAEVSDVANAVLDGTDAVMLSAETATGDFPIKVVSILNEICLEAEQYRGDMPMKNHDQYVERHDKAIAMSAMYIANHVEIQAIVALTESGSTPLWMSRIRSGIPIYALSRFAKTCGRATLFRGVYPVEFDFTQFKPWEISKKALEALVAKGLLSIGDKVIVTKGDVLGVHGFTNALKILTVN